MTGCFVVISLLLLMPAFTYLPYGVLAAIIEVAVVGLVDVDAFVTSWRVFKPEFIVSSFTFISVLGLGIEIGVLMGAALSVCFALRRAAVPRVVILGRVHDQVPHAGGTWRDTSHFQNAFVSKQTIIVRVDSAIFFANTSHIEQQCLRMAKDLEIECSNTGNVELKELEDEKQDDAQSVPDAWIENPSKKDGSGRVQANKKWTDHKSGTPRKFIIHLSSVDYIDLSGVHMLHSLEKALAGRNFELTLSHPRGPVRDMLQKASKVIKEHNGKLKSLASRTFDSINEAIAGRLMMMQRRCMNLAYR